MLFNIFWPKWTAKQRSEDAEIKQTGSGYNEPNYSKDNSSSPMYYHYTNKDQRNPRHNAQHATRQRRHKACETHIISFTNTQFD